MSTSTFLLSSVCSSISLLISPPIAAATWYVDAEVALSGDGGFWQTAFKAIQEEIDAGIPSDTVVVAQGVYQEYIQLHGRNIIVRSTDALDRAVPRRGHQHRH